MQQKVKFRLSQPGVAERLQAVVQAGRKDFNEIYRSVWDMVTHDTDGVDRYKAAVAGAIAAAAPHSEERQEAQSVAELLQHAGQCKSLFEEVVDGIVAQCQGGGNAHVATAFPQANVPASLKKVSRITEKLLLNLIKLAMLIPPFIFLARLEFLLLGASLAAVAVVYFLVMRPASLMFISKHLTEILGKYNS